MALCVYVLFLSFFIRKKFSLSLLFDGWNRNRKKNYFLFTLFSEHTKRKKINKLLMINDDNEIKKNTVAVFFSSKLCLIVRSTKPLQYSFVFLSSSSSSSFSSYVQVIFSSLIAVTVSAAFETKKNINFFFSKLIN